jgi:hypothetical protein
MMAAAFGAACQIALDQIDEWKGLDFRTFGWSGGCEVQATCPSVARLS